MNFKLKTKKTDFDPDCKISVVKAGLIALALAAVIVLMIAVAVLGMSPEYGEAERKEMIAENTVNSINL